MTLLAAQERVEKLWQDLNDCEALTDCLKSDPENWRRACEVSDFLVETACRFPDTVLPLFADDVMREALLPEDCRALLRQQLENCNSDSSLAACLRRFRRYHQFRIIWRDLVLRVGYATTVSELSAVADLIIDEALSHLYAQACERYGTPRYESGDAQRMVVLGMGKLGARELNVSSDIDLIFAFPERGETDGRRALDNQTFFTRLGQQLIQALDKNTADGFVFRVDMRLRPYGSSGALALCFSALEEYYADQGRDWERYAMIKARPVAGDVPAGERLLASLSPWIYRKYVDYSVIESLRSMKALIQSEVKRKGLSHNIKLGEGGIREVEFIVQAFQLVRGGRDPELRERRLLVALAAMEGLELMPLEGTRALREAYLFLRDLEHALQGLADRQTQVLPDGELEQWRVARALNFATWAELESCLEAHRGAVAEQFSRVIVDRRQEEEACSEDLSWEALWRGEGDPDEWLNRLAEERLPDPASFYRRLVVFRDSARIRQLQAQGRERLDRFMPLLIRELVERGVKDDITARVFSFVEAVVRRSAYLVLLLENPAALNELLRLFQESSWIAERIAEMPLLLDELLHAQSLYNPPLREDLEDELRQALMRVPVDDLEAQMDALRYFKNAHVLRVAASDLRGTLPLMKVSDYLTGIAETLLESVVDLGWQDMVRRYGRPRVNADTPCDTNFGVIGYGKLGGIELSYGSDLDLVFMHGAATDLTTDGDKSIDNQLFFTRLSQRLIHILSTRMASGDVYEVDMRLRPSGNSGMMVSSLQAFERYQQTDAWTWEHQALVRARFVAGCEQIREAFDAIRQRILCQPRDPAKLLKDVLSMREKMRDNLATRPAADGTLPHFNLKHDPGGIVDIEFMVQYMAIRWASTHPEVIRWSDNIRILEALAAVGRIQPEDANRLCEHYRQLRAYGHRMALQGEKPKAPVAAFQEERAWVQDAWQRLMTVD